ncbi:site-specific DNA-methyltransferase [Viridibacillus sp. FSL H7-0596]|uniref:site-specific DNA-methyltransferase n=1 Tax=Viridibacillus sp. FSL H7-0596 TaxID=1928923 RepID=UPI00143B8C68|nr:site-specific DNA-methyltransferase [Viridibacillus sp. FSL H7-0596]
MENNTEMESNEKLLILKSQYPQFFDHEGAFQFEQFKDYLYNANIEHSMETFSLNFVGKEYAKLLSDVETDTVVTPLTNKEIEQDLNSKNTYYIGDNLHVLKHLRHSYENKIDVIYIDPPYNTGSDRFSYNDDFLFSLEELTEIVGNEEKAQRILDLHGRSSHSAWLTFMYPRLLLGYKLLRNTGVMFVSIDDNEQTNLKFLLDELFGESNMIANNTVIVKTEGRRYGYFAKTHETLYAYAKDAELVQLREVPKVDNTFDYFDENGGYDLQGLRNRNAKKFNITNRKNLYYPFYVNSDVVDEYGFMPISLEPVEGWEEIYPAKTNGNQSVWRWGQGEGEKARVEFHNLTAKRSDRGQIQIYQKKRSETEPQKTLWQNKAFTSFRATRELEGYFGTSEYFETPKPISLLERVLEISPAKKDMIILDYFSGSSTTADAVMRMNAKDHLKRQYIMVQLPEEIPEDKLAYKDGYRTLDELGRKRIRLAAEKINEETKENIDYGFRTFEVRKAPILSLDQVVDFSVQVAEQISIGFNAEDYVAKYDYKGINGVQTLLATWLLRDGYGRLAKAAEVKLGDYTAYQFGKRLYLIQEGLISDNVVELLKMIDNKTLNVRNVTAFIPSMRFDELRELDIALRTRKGISLEKRVE